MAEVNGLQNVKTNTAIALQNYNSDHNVAWDFGTNWSNVKTDFETFINKYLFPKLNESTLTTDTSVQVKDVEDGSNDNNTDELEKQLEDLDF